MIDTHTHLYMPEYDLEGQAAGSLEGQRAAVERALAAGVTMMILPNVDMESVGPIKALHQMCPASTAMALGLHPTEVKESWRDDLGQIMANLTPGAGYKAVGEVGIDLYWDRTFEQAQMLAFEQQLEQARRMQLPVIIHCREGLDQCLEVMQSYTDVPAVFHSFGGTAADVERIRRLGDYYFGINGIVTFKNSTLADTLPAIGPERILTETDAPFLAPAPHRGKRNETALMPLVVQRIADAMGTSPQEVDAITTASAQHLFKL